MSTLQRIFGLGLVLLLAAYTASARADQLLFGLKHSHIRISTNFRGLNVFVYGSTSQPGDIVIRITSLDGTAALSRKVRVGPLWLNGGKQRIAHVPDLVYLLSNRPLDEIAARPVLENAGLTYHSILTQAQVDGKLLPGYEGWESVLERLKQKSGLYRKMPAAVQIDNGTLFSANIPLPALLPVGTYQMGIFAFEHGKLKARETDTLRVHEVGIEHWISRITRYDSAVFGVLFTLFAVSLGLALSMLLRRDHGRRP